MNDLQASLASIQNTQHDIIDLYERLVHAEIMNQMIFNGFSHLHSDDMEGRCTIADSMREQQQEIDQTKRLLANKQTLLKLKMQRFHRQLQ